MNLARNLSSTAFGQENINLSRLVTAAQAHPQPARLRIAPAKASTDVSRIVESYSKLPLSFEINQGQTDPRVKFLSRGAGYTFFLTPDEAVLALQGRSQESGVRSQKAENDGLESRAPNPERRAPAVLRMKLLGANESAKVIGMGELPGKTNYFIGNDPKKWRTNVPNYGKVRFEDVYPGIDLVYYGNQRQLEYDWVVRPGADPAEVRFAIGGAKKVRVNKHGDLEIRVDSGEVRFLKPVVYQETGARGSGLGAGGNFEGQTNAFASPETRIPNPAKHFLDSRFVLLAKNQIGFKVAQYDHSRPLIIDPTLAYSTYLGGTGTDIAFGIAVDSSGSAYITGQAGSSNFPISGGLPSPNDVLRGTDAFVTKLNAAGNGFVYSTFIGGSSSDQANGIVLDSAKNAYIAGFTVSADYPLANAYQSVADAGVCSVSPCTDDAVVTELSASGSSLIYSTFLGGAGRDNAIGITVDQAATPKIYVTGFTLSSNFPTSSKAYQGTCSTCSSSASSRAFVTELDPSQSGAAQLIYSTYMGGTTAFQGDVGRGIALDSSSGNIYITGNDQDTDFPTTTGAFQTATAGGQDAFLAVFNPASPSGPNSLLYSTLLGGSNADLGTSVVVDASGNAYVTGYTNSGTGASTLFPTKNAFQPTSAPGQQDAFITKINPAGAGASDLIFSTFLGGSSLEVGNAITLDSSGNIYVAGQTSSSDFPTASPTQTTGGSAFVTKMDPLASGLIFSTRLGGSGGDIAYGLALDTASPPNIYVSGRTTSSTDFPTVNAVQGTFGGGVDAFAAKFSNVALTTATLSPTSFDFGATTVVGTTSSSQTFTLANIGVAAMTITDFSINTVADGKFNILSSGTCPAPPFNLSAGAPCTIDVNFEPFDGNLTSATLSVTDDAGNSPQTASLSGTGLVTGPLVQFSGTSFSNGLTFAPQLVGTSSEQLVVLSNNGVATLNFTSPIQASGDYSITNYTCGATLPPGTGCTFGVDFSPTVTGPDNGTVTVFDDAPFSPQSFSVTGTGFAPVPQISLPLSPAAKAAGSGGITPLTVNGTGFVPGAVVKWNGSSVGVGPTNFVNSNQVNATIAASNVATEGTASVTVVNPASVSSVSNVAFFQVTSFASLWMSNTDYPAAPLPTTFAPNSVVTGDFNGDGKLDVAVGSTACTSGVALICTGSVSISLGNGDGTFQFETSVQPLPAVAGIVAGDFNGDHVLDLAVTSARSNLVTVLLGNGDGTFQSPATYSTGTGPIGIAVGDFDGDGKLDIVTADYDKTANSVSVLLGNGDGTFQTHVEYATGAGPYAVAVGDFNGDFKPDLAVTNYGGNDNSVPVPVGSTVSILLGNGNGTFQAKTDYVTGSSRTVQGPTAIGTGDFNNDGKLDLAVANTSANAANILLGNGDGTFQLPSAPYTTGTGPSSVSIGDFDGDGFIDIALVNQSSTGFTVLTGFGDGTFSSTTGYPTGGSPLASAVGDFNRDGRLDLVSANANDGTFSILLQVPLESQQTSLSFGDQTVGSPSLADGFTVANLGSAPLAFSSVSVDGTNAADFTITGNTCPLVGQPSGCSATSGFFSGFPAGSYPFSGIFYVTAPNGNGDRLVVGTPALGTAGFLTALGSVPLPSPSVSNQEFCDFVPLSPTLQVFAYVPTDAEKRGDFSAFTAAGGVLIDPSTGLAVPGGILSPSSTFWAWRIPGNAIQTGGIPGGATCTISVTVTPSTSGPLSAEVVIASNTKGVLNTVSLDANGVQPVATLSPTSLTFGNQLVGTPSTGQSVTLTNGPGSTSPLNVKTISVTGANPGDFLIGPGTNACNVPGTLAINEVCDFVVTFKPTATGTRSASVAVADNASGSPQTVTLSGTGIAPIASFSPTSWSFGSQELGTTSSQTITLTNTGTATLDITSLSITGTNTGDFAITNNACPASLGVGLPCTFDVSFTPQATGARSASVTLNSTNASGSVPLSGTGTRIRIININSTTNIVNISGKEDGAAVSQNNFTLWFQPFNTSGPTNLLELPVQAGTYSFRIISPTDAQTQFPSLTSLQLSQMGAGWTYNFPWITTFLVFDVSAASNGGLPELVIGARSPTGSSDAQSAYNAAVDAGITTTYYTFTAPTTVIFALPDNILSDNNGIISVLVSPATPASNTTFVNVAGSAGPWNFVNGGLNTNFQYGSGNQTSPTVISSASGIPFSPGSTVTFNYISGFVSAGPQFSLPFTDAEGDLGEIVNNIGSKPSQYIPSAQYPVYLNELVGVFTDSTGAIVGAPFNIGNTGAVTIPLGATQLQLGVNDDNFADNAGAWTIQATVTNPVPLINQPLVPAAIAPGSGAVTVNINGTGFVSGATVKVNGSTRSSSFVSPSHMTVDLAGADTAAAGTLSIVVVNPAPVGGTSNTAFLPITNSTAFVTTSRTDVGVGNDPASVAVADFNGDGKLDVAVSNQLDNNVSVVLGNGDGTFQAAVNYPAGSNPISVDVGDFNADGKLDLAVANYGANNVSVLLGNGDGTFQAAVNSAAGSDIYWIATADLNGDGNLDLVVANGLPNSINVLVGNGDGTFKAPVTYAAGTGPRWVSIADFNGDGRLDVAVANVFSGDVSILLGNGDGTFQPATTFAAGSYPHSIAVGDFNGDGKPDLAVVNQMSNDTSVLLGNGDGTFTAAISYAVGADPISAAEGDLNGDGKLDFVVANAGDRTASILLGNGNGTFTLNNFTPGTGTSPFSVAAADFNGDGRLDLAVANGGSASVSILLQSPGLTLSGPNLVNNVLTMPATPTNLVCNPRTLTLTNSGSAPLAITSITSSDNTLFAISANTCPASPATLGPGANCNVSVTFHPAATGTVTGTLTITSNAPASPQTVNLSGTGQQPCPLAAAAASQRVLRGTDRTTFTVEPNATCQATDQIQLACVNTNPATCTFNPGTIQNPQKSILTMQGLNGVAGNSLNFQVTGTSPDFIQRTLDLAVNFSDFWFTTYPAEKTVAAGERATFAVSVVPINGLTGQMKLTCTGAPAGGSCSVVPSTITVGKDAPVQVQVRVETSSGAMAPLGEVRRPGPPNPGLRFLVLIVGLVSLLMAVFTASSTARGVARLRNVIPAQAGIHRFPISPMRVAGLALLLMVVTWASCGGGGTSPLSGGGSTAGKYSIVMTGTFTPSSGSGMVYDPSAPPLTHNVTMILHVR